MLQVLLLVQLLPALLQAWLRVQLLTASFPLSQVSLQNLLLPQLLLRAWVHSLWLRIWLRPVLLLLITLQENQHLRKQFLLTDLPL